MAKKNKIQIKAKNKGKFTKWAKEHGMSVQEAANHVMANKEKYSSTIVKRANFAKNFAHEDGGEIDMYPNGGTTNPPIYTYDPNDPRIQHYTDSLLYYNGQDGTDYVGAANRLGLSIYDSNRTNFPKPVQPIVYKLWFNNLGGDYVGATESIKSFNTKMPTEINPIPFEPGTYFTRKRQSQELGRGKTDYFDKKTGKLLGTYENGGYFAIGGEINRYMVPAELPTGQEYFKLPFSELNAALANKQALYDKADTELSAIDKLFPEAGYRTQDRLQALKDKYIPQIESLRTQLGETGNVNPTKIREIASRLVQDPEYKTITQDFKYKEAVDKVMSTGNFKDYIQGFYDPNTGFNQTKPGEGFNGQWYGAIAPASWIDEYRQYTDFKPIKDNIEKSTGYQMRLLS